MAMKMEVTVDQLAALAVEHWRMATVLGPALEAAGAGATPVRHALRKMGDVLKAWEIEARSLDGMPYDAGLAARVIDTVEAGRAAGLKKGEMRIVETVSPLVMRGGEVVRTAEVVIEKG
ncbi:MAG TPA: hypothetical protein VH253_16480 [Phycisphaerae bacterium]|nr:hypothetical protein [Phycisphaerae bacterium]